MTEPDNIWGADRDHLRIKTRERIPITRKHVVSEFDVIVPGEVRGHGRPRAVVGRSGKARTYTAKVDLDHRGRIEASWLSEGAPRLPEQAYYEARIAAVFRRPASHFKSDGVSLNATGRRTPFPGKPDLDNLAKNIDVFVKCGAIPDDARMVRLLVIKHYMAEYELPGTYFTFRAINVLDDEDDKGNE
jgi:hypothetical protein